MLGMGPNPVMVIPVQPGASCSRSLVPFDEKFGSKSKAKQFTHFKLYIDRYY